MSAFCWPFLNILKENKGTVQKYHIVVKQYEGVLIVDEKVCVFQKGELIFKEGAYERCMYDIISGSVCIFANYGTDEEKLLTTLDAGCFFGEIGITEILPRTATAVAGEGGARLNEITGENFSAYFYREPEKLLAIMKHMSRRLRALTQEYMEAVSAVSEAVETAKRGGRQSDSLSAKLSDMVRNYLVPSFLKTDKGYDEAAFMNAHGAAEEITKVFKKNEVIFREGDAANCLYDIRWGSVGIYADYGKESQKLLTQLNAEEFFGEMGLLEGMPRSATAVALESNTRVQLISEAMFGQFLQDRPAKVMMIMMHLSSRIRGLTKDYMAVCRLAAGAAEAAEEKKENEYWSNAVVDYYLDAYNMPSDPWDYYSRCYK